MSRTALISGNLVEPRSGVVASLVETTKPGIVRLVVITSMVGFAMAGAQRSWEAWELVSRALVCLGGTALSAAGANALNQWWERARDERMKRTARRPLPTQRLSPRAVLWFGVSLSSLGVALLLVLGNPVAAAISLACVLVYVLVYTPMKPSTPWATLVGAIPGALPPLIGWSAAGREGGWPAGWSSLSQAGGWVLFAIMFAWQIPHFLAIAWMYRDDYAAGGFRVLPVLDPEGVRTSRSMARWTAALIPLTFLPLWAMRGQVGLGYAAVALVSGAVFITLVGRLARARTRDAARRVFFATIIHLPVLMATMVIEAIARVALG